MTGAPLKFQEVSGAEARESGLANAESRRPLHPRRARAARAAGRRRPHPHHQDLQGSEELLPRRQRHRVRSAARHQAQRRRPAAGLRARVVQHSVAGDRGAGRPRRHQLHEHLSGPGAARAARQARSSSRRRAGGCAACAASPRAATPGDSDASVPPMERVRVSRARVSRIARSSTSSRAPRPTRSASTTTTPRRAKAPTSTSTSCARAAPCRIRRRRFSTPARRSRSRR